MKVTVIIPTFKPKEYIWECLDSVANQTFPKDDFEVIIVLNGCCEPWKNDIDRYINQNMNGINVRFIQTDFPGVSNARNIALDNAEGQYVAFLDDDDFVSENYLSQLYEKASEDTISLCYPYAFIDGCAEQQIKYAFS